MCIPTIKWRKMFLWFFGLVILIALIHWGNLFVIIQGYIAIFFLAFMIVTAVWARAVHGESLLFVGLSWLFAYSFNDLTLRPQRDTDRAKMMRKWCRDNLEGTWVQCHNGDYFAIRKKTDALAFKLRWI